MPEQPKEIVISKEDAVFWLDQNGLWHNEHGRFEHKKIIDFFHQSIRRDEAGYHLRQQLEGSVEKVYFPYEDTALFVFDVIRGPDIVLALNTLKKIPLNPDKLFIKADQLYITEGEDLIKFTERAMMKMADLIEEENGSYCITVGSESYVIRTDYCR